MRLPESNCTANTIKQYLQGTIPDDKGDDGPDVLCQVEQGPFGLREFGLILLQLRTDVDIHSWRYTLEYQYLPEWRQADCRTE
jgi:hypothetical protein